MDNIKIYAESQNIVLTNQEAAIIYEFIKTYYNDLLEKRTDVFKYLKLKLSPNIYNKAVALYKEYASRYL